MNKLNYILPKVWGNGMNSWVPITCFALYSYIIQCSSHYYDFREYYSHYSGNKYNEVEILLTLVSDILEFEVWISFLIVL